MTPVAADGAGFVDLVLVHPARGVTLFRELKARKGRMSPAQEQWGVWLTAGGNDWGVWRPADWSEIVDVLTFGAGT